MSSIDTVISLLEKQGRQSVAEIANASGLAVKTIQWALRKMHKEGIAAPIETVKTGQVYINLWSLIEEEEPKAVVKRRPGTWDEVPIIKWWEV